jgi:hypothetical protein
MKKIITLTLVTLLSTSGVLAQGQFFTTLTSIEKDVYAGVKIEKKGDEPETYILQVSGEGLTSKKIMLPEELAHREVVALIPAEKKQLVLVSQRTIEQGDKLQFHLFNPEKEEWKKLSELDCNSFAKMKKEKKGLVLNCISTDEKGKEIEKKKNVSFKEVTLYELGEVTLPLSKIQNNLIQAELLGDSFEWKDLKVGINKKEKVFRP